MEMVNGRVKTIDLLLVVLILLGPAYAGEIYRWTDADGIIHITDRPPPNGAAVGSVFSYPNHAEPKAQSKVVPVQPPAASRQVEQLNRQLNRLKERRTQLQQIVAENEQTIAAAQKDADYLSRRSGAYARRNQKAIQRQLMVLNNNLTTYQNDLKYVKEDIAEVEERLKAIDSKGKQGGGVQDDGPHR